MKNELYNQGMKMDGLYPAVLKCADVFQMLCLSKPSVLNPPATYA